MSLLSGLCRLYLLVCTVPGTRTEATVTDKASCKGTVFLRLTLAFWVSPPRTSTGRHQKLPRNPSQRATDLSELTVSFQPLLNRPWLGLAVKCSTNSHWKTRANWVGDEVLLGCIAQASTTHLSSVIIHHHICSKLLQDPLIYT